VARLAGQWLDLVTHEQRHRPLIDASLRKLAAMLDNDELKLRMAEVIASEVKYLRFVGLDNVAGRYANDQAGGRRDPPDRRDGDDPAHPLRAEFDELRRRAGARLKDEPQLRERVEAMKRSCSPTGARRLRGRAVGRRRALAAGRPGTRRLAAARAGRERGAGGRREAAGRRADARVDRRAARRAPRRAGSSVIARTSGATSSRGSARGTRRR
jgi:hypothetical protein